MPYWGGQPAQHFADLLSGPTPGLRPHRPAGPPKGVELTYLGTSGFLIEWDGAMVVLGPYFSHANFWRLGFGRLRPQTEVIETYLDPLATQLAAVEAILVGHGHYDHLLDLPYIVEHYARRAKVYGNRAVGRILAATGRAEVLAGAAVRGPAQPGQWIEVNGGSFRFMALASGHAPNLWGYTIAQGQTKEPLVRPPLKAGGWKEGQTLAYMVDLRDKEAGKTVFRIYFQDAAHVPEAFHRPADGRPIDLAILCVAAFEEAAGDNYPEAVKAVLQPRQYVLSHWENFFRPYTRQLEQLRAVPLTRPRDLVERLKKAPPAGAVWTMPLPGMGLAY